MKTLIKTILICCVLFVSLHAQDKVITMGYKSISKLPLIGANENDEGLYKDLFSKAAKKIGYELKIIRYPKKRLHYALEQGLIDFYPGSSFSKKRAQYLYYLPNGLETKEVLVSLDTDVNYQSMDEVKGKLVVELGSSKIEWDELYPNISIVQLGKLSMHTITNAIRFRRGDFYIADIEVVNYYKRIKKIKKYSDIGLKIHHNAINKNYIPMHLGFSRKSKLFKETTNEDFDENISTTIQNFPTVISKNSVAFKFYQALMQIKKEGTTKELYNLYF